MTRTRTKAAPLRMALVVVLVVLLRTTTTIIQVAEAASTSSSSSFSNNNNKNQYLHGQQPREKQGVAGCWNHVNAAAPDAILGIAQAFRDCTDPRKVNICVGAYRNDDGQPWILPSVQRAEELLLQQQQHQQQGAAAPAAQSSSFDKARMETKEYLPIEGDVEFLECALQFAYGEELYRHLVTATTNRIASVQTLSGTGACSVGGYFLARFMQGRRQQQRQQTPKEQEKDQLRPRIYLPTPTWSNHWNVFRQCGLEPCPYRYYNSKTNDLDFEGLLEDLNAAPMGSAVLLHACAHNPTGCDPNLSQWKQIAKVMQQRRLVAFFDSAYQGFVSGNANQDAEAFRYFVSNYGTWDDATSKKRAWLRRLGRFRGLSNPSVTTTTTTIPILLAQSFAKNFGLYGERCGTLSILCQTTSERDCVLSQLRSIIRPLYSSPPRHGSSIVKTILRNETLKEQYKTDCATHGSSHSNHATSLGNIAARITTTSCDIIIIIFFFVLFHGTSLIRLVSHGQTSSKGHVCLHQLLDTGTM